MPRHRRRYRRSVAIPRPKYSSETVSYDGTLSNPGTTAGQWGTLSMPLIPPITAFGRRKAKYFTLRLQALGSYRATNRMTFSSVYFAVVFVPEGTTANQLQISADQTISSFYEPNQNVIMSGIFDNNQVYTFRSRLSRNLNSNDSVWIVMRDNITNGTTTDSMNTDIALSFNYAITF